MKINILFVIIISYFAMFINSCKNTANPTDYETNNKFSNRLDAIGDSLTSENNPHTVGAIIGVISAGSNFTYMKAFGHSDFANNIPLNRNDEFRLGTLTESFVATLTFILAEQGAISLDDNISKYLDLPHSGNYIKIRDLLQHKSSYPDFIDSVNFYQSTEPNRIFTYSELVNFVYKQRDYFMPTSSIKFSYFNYYLLGKILENATNESLEDLIKRKILEPLHLDNTYFDNKAEFKSVDYSHGYILNENKQYVDVSHNRDYSWAWASANMTSTTQDLIKWVSYLTEGTLISRDSRNEMQKFIQYYNINNLSVYLGMGLMRIGSFQGYTGRIDGYNVNIYYLPSKQTTILVFTNSENNNENLLIQIAQILYPSYRAD